MGLKDILDFIKLVLPFLVELIKILKGQSSETKADALARAKNAAKKHCDGVACAPEIKKV